MRNNCLSHCNVVGALLLTLAALAITLPEACAKPVARKGNEAAATTSPVSPLSSSPLTHELALEWQKIDDEARPLLAVVAKKPKDVPARQGLADLALRAAGNAEQAMAHGDEALFGAFRKLIETRFSETRWRLDMMAGKGVGEADFALGVMYLYGILEKHNVDQACKRFAAALLKGFLNARFRHGQCLEESNPKAALAQFEGAASTGHPAAMEKLGRLCLENSRPDAKCGAHWLGLAAKNGRTSAMTLLGWMHAEGIGGTQDLAKAAALYREAAKRGEPSAYNNLGELLENGRGVEKDARAAFGFYQKAAEMGFPPAQFNVGRLYAGGKGVEKNIVEARRWLGLAEKAGIDNAKRIIELLDGEKNKPPG